MSYRTTINLQHPFYWSSALANRDALAERVVLHLGNAGRLVRLTETMDQAVVEYDLGGDNQFDSHHTVLQRFEWAAGTLAVQAFEAEVVQIVRYGVQAATVGGLTALGATAKQKGEVAFVASVLAAFAGFLVGELLPRQQVILRATRHPLYGWTWTELNAPLQFGWRPATT
jgi:hypothetical protein